MEEKQKHFKCDICESQATILCLNCSGYYYCDSCYKYIHDFKAKSQHTGEKIDYFLTIDAKCPIHKTNSLNLFCIDEKGINN